jgi:uncharacterized protein (TIGR02448 family)
MYSDGRKKHDQIIRIFIGLIVLLLSSCSFAIEEIKLTKLVSYVGAVGSSETTEAWSFSVRYARFSPEAVEDAAAFVASEGVISGPFLESAILELRTTTSPNLSGRDIAGLILGGS